MSADLEAVNTALMRIGANPLNSEADENAPQHLRIWDAVLRRIFATPFSCAKVKRRLVQLPTPDPPHYKFAFQLPTDRLGMPRAVYRDVECRKPWTEFDVEGDRLLIDEPQVWMSYMRMPPWGRMGGDLQELLLTATMAEFALSIREDRPLHDRLYQKAFGTPSEKGFGGMMGACLEGDAQGQVSTVIDGGANPLIDVRF